MFTVKPWIFIHGVLKRTNAPAAVLSFSPFVATYLALLTYLKPDGGYGFCYLTIKEP